MFQGYSVWAIVQAGGPTMYVLLGCSFVSLAVIVERLIYYWVNSAVARNAFLAALRKAREKGGAEAALAVCAKVRAPFSRVAAAGLKVGAGAPEAMEREIAIETMRLERYTSIVGTIGSVAVYIGLFGTVLGIIRAFGEISGSAGEGMNRVIGGVAEALVSTAAGLVVAVPAVVAYNYFTRRIERFVTDMELVASEIGESRPEGRR